MTTAIRKFVQESNRIEGIEHTIVTKRRTHLSVNGEPLCNVRYRPVILTDGADQVTCGRCLAMQVIHTPDLPVDLFVRKCWERGNGTKDTRIAVKNMYGVDMSFDQVRRAYVSFGVDSIIATR